MHIIAQIYKFILFLVPTKEKVPQKNAILFLYNYLSPLLLLVILGEILWK